MPFLLTPLLLFAQIHFVWLTDLHVGSPTGLDDLREAVADITTLEGVRFALLTGDITETGSTEELLSARAALDKLAVPYYIIPGNHDTKWSESGGTAFPSIFGRERFSQRVDEYLLLGFHQGPRMRMADGHFAPEDLRWIDSALVPARTGNLPVLVATHYPLDSGICNWYEATRRLQTTDTRLVFTGHGHKNRTDTYQGIHGVMGRSLLRGTMAQGGYNIVTISGDSITIAERTTGVRTAEPWYVHSLEPPRRLEADQASRPDFAMNRDFPDVRIRWKVATGSTILAGGAVREDRFIAGTYAGTLHALRLSDGVSLWNTRVPGRFTASPAAESNRVVISSTDSALYCFDLRSGEHVWKVMTGAPLVAAPAIVDGVVYTGSGDGRFRALDLRTGRIVWTTPGINAFVEARPAVGGDIVVVGAWDETLYAFGRRDGALRWSWRGEQQGRLLSPAACWPVLTQNRVFVVAPDRMMTALDAATGQVLWRTGKHQVRESIGAASDGSRIYVRTMRDSLVAIDPASPGPDDIWSIHAGFGYDINAAMPQERDGVLFYGTMRGVLMAVDAAIGDSALETSCERLASEHRFSTKRA